MAVLPGVPGISVSVKIDGEIATEYNDPDREEETTPPEIPTSSCYIESKTGAPFSFEIKVDPSYTFPYPRDSLSCELFIDGVLRGNLGWQKISIPSSHFIKGFWAPKEQYNGQSVMTDYCYLRFGEVTTVDDNTKARVEQDKTVAKDLGTLEVVLRVARFDCRLSRPSFVPFNDLKGEFKLAEKALKGKALSHGTVTTSVSTKTPGTLHMSRYVTVGSFQFKYRSLESLKEEFIVPRSPSPEVSLENLSRAEIKRLALERLQERKNQTSLMKRERDDGSSATQTPMKKAKTSNEKVPIDLTGEDSDSEDL